MRYFDSRVIVIMLIIRLRINLVFGGKKIFTHLLKPICEERYRQKYFLDDTRDKFLPLLSTSRWENNDSEFLPIDNNSPGSSEFLIHDRGNRLKKWKIFQNSSWHSLRREKLRKHNILTSVIKTELNDNDKNANQTSLRQLSGWAKNACASRRIVGGWSPNSAEEFPYLVFVDTGCGGAIIGDVWVLSAAHCVDEENPRYIHAGSLDLLGGCQYSVTGVHIHPKFSRTVLEYDLSLIKIKPKFVYSPAIMPIKLSKTRARYNMCGVVAGWGAEEYLGPPSVKVLMALIPVISRSKCYMFDIKIGQFCAGYAERKSDSCQGDSGGPFVVDNYVVGIVSYGFECARPAIPGVYVDVFHHRRWINSVANIQ